MIRQSREENKHAPKNALPSEAQEDDSDKANVFYSSKMWSMSIVHRTQHLYTKYLDFTQIREEKKKKDLTLETS